MHWGSVGEGRIDPVFLKLIIGKNFVSVDHQLTIFVWVWVNTWPLQSMQTSFDIYLDYLAKNLSGLYYLK